MSNDLKCPNCGKLNPPDISFCIGCNLSVSVFDIIAKKKEKQPISCSNCGHENPSSLSICEECGEKIDREIEETEEKKERKEMTRTQQILLIIGAIVLLPLVIVGFILFFIINAITRVSKGKIALEDLGIDAYSELEKGRRKR
ncbi:MAG: double zinc ribbon domain-containing protein [Candidatus Heimdallarchaeaceae archaeon]|jgi:uncharacterized membrane protein YvbJ